MSTSTRFSQRAQHRVSPKKMGAGASATERGSLGGPPPPGADPEFDAMVEAELARRRGAVPETVRAPEPVLPPPSKGEDPVFDALVEAEMNRQKREVEAYARAQREMREASERNPEAPEVRPAVPVHDPPPLLVPSPPRAHDPIAGGETPNYSATKRDRQREYARALQQQMLEPRRSLRGAEHFVSTQQSPILPGANEPRLPANPLDPPHVGLGRGMATLPGARPPLHFGGRKEAQAAYAAELKRQMEEKRLRETNRRASEVAASRERLRRADPVPGLPSSLEHDSPGAKRFQQQQRRSSLGHENYGGSYGFVEPPNPSLSGSPPKGTYQGLVGTEPPLLGGLSGDAHAHATTRLPCVNQHSSPELAHRHHHDLVNAVSADRLSAEARDSARSRFVRDVYGETHVAEMLGCGPPPVVGGPLSNRKVTRMVDPEIEAKRRAQALTQKHALEAQIEERRQAKAREEAARRAEDERDLREAQEEEARAKARKDAEDAKRQADEQRRLEELYAQQEAAAAARRGRGSGGRGRGGRRLLDDGRGPENNDEPSSTTEYPPAYPPARPPPSEHVSDLSLPDESRLGRVDEAEDRELDARASRFEEAVQAEVRRLRGAQNASLETPAQQRPPPPHLRGPPRSYAESPSEIRALARRLGREEDDENSLSDLARGRPPIVPGVNRHQQHRGLGAVSPARDKPRLDLNDFAPLDEEDRRRLLYQLLPRDRTGRRQLAAGLIDELGAPTASPGPPTNDWGPGLDGDATPRRPPDDDDDAFEYSRDEDGPLDGPLELDEDGRDALGDLPEDRLGDESPRPDDDDDSRPEADPAADWQREHRAAYRSPTGPETPLRPTPRQDSARDDDDFEGPTDGDRSPRSFPRRSHRAEDAVTNYAGETPNGSLSPPYEIGSLSPDRGAFDLAATAPRPSTRDEHGTDPVASDSTALARESTIHTALFPTSIRAATPPRTPSGGNASRPASGRSVNASRPASGRSVNASRPASGRSGNASRPASGRSGNASRPASGRSRPRSGRVQCGPHVPGGPHGAPSPAPPHDEYDAARADARAPRAQWNKADPWVRDTTVLS